VSIFRSAFPLSRLRWHGDETKHAAQQDRSALVCDPAITSASSFANVSEAVIRGRSMKNAIHSLAQIGLLVLAIVVPANSVSAQTDIAKAVQEKLAAESVKLQNSCAEDIKKYCSDVTPGEGRMIYCMQAHEDKISPKCAFDLEEAATDIELSADNLKGAVNACREEITGVCGKTQPGQGRVAACVMAHKSTASKSCVEAIGKIEAMVAR
jgi:hypothetical protein